MSKISQNVSVLIALYTEELPAQYLNELSKSLSALLQEWLTAQGFSFQTVKIFASPQHLGVLFQQVPTQLADKKETLTGPAWSVAFDEHNKPKPAAMGFAKRCQVAVEALKPLDTKKGVVVSCDVLQVGQSLSEALQRDLSELLEHRWALPAKMRWGAHQTHFVRPVHGLTVMMGDQLVPVSALTCDSTNQVPGHRFLNPEPVTIAHAEDYAKTLEKAFVMVCPEKRRASILEQCQRIEATLKPASIDCDDDLLDEVVHLVEWPVVMKGQFDEAFTSLPSAVPVVAMKQHQRYFPVYNENKQLSSQFIFVSNMAVSDPSKIIEGNERVIRARLNDAQFFYQQDCQVPLSAWQEKLSQVVFQKSLGTVGDKVERTKKLLTHLFEDQAWLTEALRAAELMRVDSMSAMVYEFSEVAGTMGRDYALHAGESEAVACAIEEAWLPKHATDALPSTLLGAAVGVSDKMDTLVGLFGIGQPPTGNKDPFACRRAALGVLKILLENPTLPSLDRWIETSFLVYQEQGVSLKEAQNALMLFFRERLKVLWSDQGFDKSQIESVLSSAWSSVCYARQKLEALQSFCDSEQADTLIDMNKRVSNILKKQTLGDDLAINVDLFEHPSEKTLFETDKTAYQVILKSQSPTVQLKTLLTLSQPLSDFFENNMVMAEDLAKRQNRLALLAQVSRTLKHVVDLSVVNIK